MNSFPLFNLKDFDDQNSSNQDYYLDQPNYFQITLPNSPELNQQTNIHMENLGNSSKQVSQSKIHKKKTIETQNQTNTLDQSIKIDQTQTIAIFQRIFMKIVSSYLNHISSEQRKMYKKMIYFDKCQLFNNLQLESSFTTLTQIINRIELTFSQKCTLLNFIDSNKQVQQFLSNSLINGYEQINNQFVYFVFMLAQELKSFNSKIQQNHEYTVISTSEIQSSNKDKQNMDKFYDQIEMKKYLESDSFFERVFYQKSIKYINCRQIVSPVSDQKIKSSFIRFIRLYSHLIIKLIILSRQVITLKNSIVKSQQQIKSVSNIKDCQNKQNKSQKSIQIKTMNPCDIIGNWFLSNACAKSFNSINSLGSINLNNLNDIKIYNSKPDLWSQGDQQNFNDFSDQQEQTKKKRKI